MFYGWYILGASILISASIGGITVYGFTAFIDPLAASLGWSYAQISLATTIRGVETGTLSPLVGGLVDRWPARRLVLIGVVLIGLGYLCLSQVNSLPMFYASFLIIGLGSTLGTMMTPTVTVARWFRKNLGKASGLLAMGIGTGGLLIPLVVKMIDSYGWQNSLIYIAIGMWVIGIPLSFVFRTRPGDYGLMPDGATPTQQDGSVQAAIDEPDVGVKEAIRMPAFWIMGIAQMFQMAAISARTTHIMPYLTSIGMERTDAGIISMFVPIVSLGARLPFGWLSDIFPKKFVAAVSMALAAVGLFLFSFLEPNTTGLLIAFIVIFGIALGGVVPLRAPLIREYFGTKKFGTILGLTRIFTTIGSILAAPMAGWIYDTRGTYYPTWLVLGGLCMLGAILMLVMPRGMSSQK